MEPAPPAQSPDLFALAERLAPDCPWPMARSPTGTSAGRAGGPVVDAGGTRARSCP